VWCGAGNEGLSCRVFQRCPGISLSVILFFILLMIVF
jgi:hypothetical protein